LRDSDLVDADIARNSRRRAPTSSTPGLPASSSPAPTYVIPAEKLKELLSRTLSRAR
jgi:hypothetical protein